jgi:hypothetical protein
MRLFSYYPHATDVGETHGLVPASVLVGKNFTSACELTSVSLLVPYDGAVIIGTTDGEGICRVVQAPSVQVATSHQTGIARQVWNDITSCSIVLCCVVCVCVYVCICVSVCLRARARVCVYICMYVRMCLCMQYNECMYVCCVCI